MAGANTRRLLTVGTGTAGIAAGVAILVAPGVVGDLPFNRVVVVLTSVLAFGFGLLAVRERRRTATDRTVVSATDRRLATPTPGDEIDDIIDEITSDASAGIERRNEIRERIGEVAADLVVHRENCSREEAIQALTDGTWTDDETAAAFFGEASAAGDESLAERARRVAFDAGRHPYREQINAVIDALAERANVPVDDAAERDGSLVDSLRGGRSDTDDGPDGPSREVAAFPTDEGEPVADGVRYRSETETNVWRGATAFGFVSAAVGVLTLQPAPLLASTVAVAVGALSTASSPPSLSGLAVERELETDAAEPGADVRVTLTVTNETDSFHPDLRIADRVPGPMRVSEGTARMAASLRAGESATLTYAVTAERGEYAWPTQVVGRDATGASEREAVFDVDAELTVSPALQTTTETAVRSKTSLYSGQIGTSTGGSGLEFFSLRQYDRGDPLNRIDWKHAAQGKGLATINYREERAATLVLLFDTRDKAYVSPDPDAVNAVNRAVAAGSEIFTSLHDSGNLVGVAAFDTVYCWQEPGAGDEHVERVRRTLTSHDALSPLPPEFSRSDAVQYVDPMTHLRRQFPTNAQIALFSPLTYDDYAAEIARRLDGAGHPVTVISPDPTATRTPGQRLARIERTLRIAHLRESGIRVVDWRDGVPLRLELDRAKRRWSA